MNIKQIKEAYLKESGYSVFTNIYSPLSYEDVDELMQRAFNAALELAAEKETLWVETPINGTEFDSIEENLGCQTDPYIQKITVFKESILSLKINS